MLLCNYSQCTVICAPVTAFVVQLIQAILHEYKHIETFLESSAKKQQSVPDIFYYAIKSVVHPTQPLVVFSSAVLQPLCIKALQRIFLLCDENQVINPYHCRCFTVHEIECITYLFVSRQ